MKKLISLLAVIVLTASVNINTINAQSFSKDFIIPGSQPVGGIYHVSTQTFAGWWDLSKTDNTYSQALYPYFTNSHIQYLVGVWYQVVFDKQDCWVVAQYVAHKSTLDTMDLVLYNGFNHPTKGKGSLMLTKDSLGTQVNIILNMDLISGSNADSFLLKDDISWYPATLDGMSGYRYKTIAKKVGTISPSWYTPGTGGLEGVNLMYLYQSASMRSLKYPRKSPTSSGPFTTVVFNNTQSVSVGSYSEMRSKFAPNKTFPVVFDNTRLFTGAISDSTGLIDFQFAPSNVINQKVTLEFYKGNTLLSTYDTSATFAETDQRPLLERIDRQTISYIVYGLPDTSEITVKFFATDSTGGRTLWVTRKFTTFKKKVVIPVETDPVLNTVSVSDVTDKTATLNLGITTGTKSGSAAVAVRVTVLDGSKVVYEGNVDIAGTQNPTNITKTVMLAELADSTIHSYTVKLLSIEKSGSFTTLKSASSGGGTNSINTINNSDISAYVDPNGFLQITETQKLTMKQIYNLNGSMIANFTTKEFDINHLPPGIYFLVVDNKSIKFLK